MRSEFLQVKAQLLPGERFYIFFLETNLRDKRHFMQIELLGLPIPFLTASTSALRLGTY
jgi:hypothetical protein